MTETEQRIALARWELPQYTWSDNGLGHVPGEEHDDAATKRELPTYDLNDMVRVRGKMNFNENSVYIEYLAEITKATGASLRRNMLWFVINATAEQHQEAALKALSLWRE